MLLHNLSSEETISLRHTMHTHTRIYVSTRVIIAFTATKNSDRTDEYEHAFFLRQSQIESLTRCCDRAVDFAIRVKFAQIRSYPQRYRNVERLFNPLLSAVCSCYRFFLLYTRGGAKICNTRRTQGYRVSCNLRKFLFFLFLGISNSIWIRKSTSKRSTKSRFVRANMREFLVIRVLRLDFTTSSFTT